MGPVLCFLFFPRMFVCYSLLLAAMSVAFLLLGTGDANAGYAAWDLGSSWGHSTIGLYIRKRSRTLAYGNTRSWCHQACLYKCRKTAQLAPCRTGSAIFPPVRDATGYTLVSACVGPTNHYSRTLHLQQKCPWKPRWALERELLVYSCLVFCSLI